MTALAILSSVLLAIICLMTWRYYRLLKTDKRLLAVLQKHEEELSYWKDLVRSSSFQIGCSIDCDAYQMLKYPDDYVKDASKRCLHSISDSIAETLNAYLWPHLIDNMYKIRGSGQGRLVFRIPMMRADLTALDVSYFDLNAGYTVPIVNSNISQRKEFAELMKLNEISDELDKLNKFLPKVDVEDLVRGLNEDV